MRGRRRSRRTTWGRLAAAALALLVALGGCGLVSEEALPAFESSAGAASLPTVGEEHAPEAVGAISMALAVPSPPPARPAPPSEPRRLVGLRGDEIEAILGAPGFRRRDNPAEVWQYRTESCVLDLFLYRRDDALTVRHVEVRGRGAAPVVETACYQALLRARAAAGRR